MFGSIHIKRSAGAIVLCLSIIFGGATGQLHAARNGNWDFTRFTSINRGLSFNNINSISQDSNGFIWIATEDGLNRYNGSSFVCYYKEELGVNTDFITSLCADGSGNMWIGTDNGATFYSYFQDCFIPLREISDKGTVINSKVTHIEIDRKGKVWMSVNGLGFFSYDPDSRELINYFSENGHTTLPVNIRTFFIDNNDEFWFSLYFFDLWHSGNSLQNMEPVFIKGWKPHDDIISIERNSANNTLYLAGWQNGLCEFDVRKRTFTNLIPNSNGFRPMGLILDKEKKLWLATTKGLYMYDTITGTTTLITADNSDRFSLADENVTAVFMDDSNGLWVSTLSSGINYCGGFHKNFEKYYTVDGELLTGSFVMDMEYDRNGKVWIATEKNGVLWLDIKKNELHSYKSPALPPSVFSLCCDGEEVWLGTWSGIYRLNPRRGAVEEYSRVMENYGVIDNKIHKIFKTSDEEILAGSSLGMMRYDPVQNAFVTVDDFNGIYITDIIETSNKELWLSSYANGIFRYCLREKRITYRYGYEEKDNFHLPVDKIMSVYQDEKGGIWAGTYGAGFMRYYPAGDRFVTFEGAGFENIRIAFSMIEDDDDRLWVATSKGLVSFRYPQGDVNYYTTKDGLLDDMIEGHSGVKTSDGNIYFSSYNGFIRFNPRQFQSDNRIPPLIVTDLVIDGKSVKPGQPGSPIDRNINEVTEITLAHNQSSFGFGLSLLGMASPASNQCWYMLEGYDNGWNKLDGDSFNYSNVPAGHYTLYIKGVNSNGLWNESHPSISITVRKVFYKTLLAKCIYAILFITIIVLVIRYFSVSAVKKERRKQDDEKRKREAEVFREKMTFFSNIIHEIKTPLTLIRTPLQNIITTGGLESETTEDLTVISNSTDYLDKLVKELLDFVRIEEHGWVLDYRQIDLVEKMDFLCFNFRETAKTKNLTLTLEHDSDRVMISVDESGLIKMLNNLIDNAVKYAETYIRLSVVQEDDFVTVSFRNDGPPIPENCREEIFKPFVQYSDEHSPYSQSFGIGLSLSRTLAEMHGGSLLLADGPCTDFILRLPIRRNPVEEVGPADGIEDAMSEGDPDNTGKPLVLVVEDNEDLAAYLVRKLSDDYRAITTVSAEKALKIIEQKDVDLVLSDIALKGMSGIDLCRRITADFNFSHIPVIMLSALSSTKTKITCIENGASLYIEKPFNLDYLLGSMKVIVQKRESLKTMHLSGHTVTESREFILTNSDSEFLVMLDRLIMNNLSDTEFGNDQLADSMFLSKSTLMRKVKGLLDTTPNEYIRTKRLNIAASMLSQGNCRINEVCYAVGFNTPSYFTKCFKRQFGMQPAEYMKEQNAKE